MAMDQDEDDDAARLREMLKRLKLGQREAARLLQLNERRLRRMCNGEMGVPRGVFLALESLIDLRGY